MVLHLLPERTGGAAENMALDFLLLQRYPAATQPRFRHYGWRGPAFSFGLSQKLEFVQTQLPPDETFDLCRRPTGGDAVDWDKFQADFTAGLAAALGMAREPTPWPDFNEDEVSGLIEQYSSSEWNEHR